MALFSCFLPQHEYSFNANKKSHKTLIINRIYYRCFLHKLLAINEFNGIVCTVNGAVRTPPHGIGQQPNDGRAKT